MGSEAERYLLDTRFPVDTRKLENKGKKKKIPHPNNPARAASRASREFQGNSGLGLWVFLSLLAFYFNGEARAAQGLCVEVRRFLPGAVCLREARGGCISRR